MQSAKLSIPRTVPSHNPFSMTTSETLTIVTQDTDTGECGRFSRVAALNGTSDACYFDLQDPRSEIPESSHQK